MPATNAEGLNIAVTEESSQGASPPPTTGWRNLECNVITDPGPDYKSMARNPYTITRQLRRPFVAGLDCALTLEVDATRDHVRYFAPGMFKSIWKDSGGKGQVVYPVTAVAADGFTVAALGDLPDGTLVKATGLENEENNGVFVVDTATGVKIVVTDTLVVEASPPANAIVEVCGFQFDADDAEIDVDGNLITTTKVLTQLALFEHQFVYLGGVDEVDPPHHFANTEYYGSAEVIDIAAHKLTLRRRSWDVGGADDGTGKTIRLFFSSWIRDVFRSDADENLVSYAIEATYPGLASGPADAYEYMLGYMLNDTTFNMATENKLTMQMTFIGKSADDPTETRVTGPSAALDPVTGMAVSTSGDFIRLSCDNVDESGLMTHFEELKVVLKNNIQAEKAIGTLGNAFTPLGEFEAQWSGRVFLETPEIVAAVHDKRILRLGAGARNDDFGFILDTPSAASMSSKKVIEHNRTVRIDSETDGFMDASSQFTAAMSYFAFLPSRAPGLET